MSGKSQADFDEAAERRRWELWKDFDTSKLEATDKHGRTAINREAGKGHANIVKHLAALKANLETKDKKGKTPIFNAAESGHAEVIKDLAALKANLETKNKVGQTPIEFAAGSELLRELLLPLDFFGHVEENRFNHGRSNITNSIVLDKSSLYSWDRQSFTWTNKKSNIKVHGHMVDLDQGSAEARCKCIHYTNKAAFDAITSSRQGLELWASKARYDSAGDMMDCGFGQGLYCVSKPTEYFSSKEDLIINNFANELFNFSDKAAAAFCQAHAALKQECHSNENFNKQCKRTCLMAKRYGQVDYGIVVSAPCSLVYNVTERATPEMTRGPGKTRKGVNMAPGRDVTVVRHEDVGEVKNLLDMGPALLQAIEDNNESRIHDLTHRMQGSGLEAKNLAGMTPIALASYKRKWQLVEDLAARNADLEAKDMNGKTPLHLAILARQVKVVEHLVALKADLEGKSAITRWWLCTPLFVAIVDQHCLSPDVPHDYNFELVMGLAALKADVNARCEGLTPLMFANRNLECAKDLVAIKADLEAKDNRGKTAIEATESKAVRDYLVAERSQGKSGRHGQDPEGTSGETLISRAASKVASLLSR